MGDFLELIAAHTWAGYVFGIVLATLIARYVAKRFFDRLERQAEKTHNLYDDAVLFAARKPVGWAIYVVGIAWAADVAGGESKAEIFNYVGVARQLAVIVLTAWFALRFVAYMERSIVDPTYAGGAGRRMDATTAAVSAKLVRAAIVITAFLIALQTMGVSVAGVLAFGGIGGIAVGFAARDLLANFFGALMIYLDRPFATGDWIRSPDRELEGTVEDIGWRLTLIRTFDQRPLYVPNGIFNNIAIENPSRMRNRRIYETIGVRYDDIEVLKDIIDDVRNMLTTHPEIDTSRTLMVNLVSFGASSVDFFVYTFTKTTVWEDFHAIKEEILFRIAAIIESHKAEIAYPTQTLLLEDLHDPG